MTASFSAEITDEMMSGFREITGDINPLHIDHQYAQTRGYSGRVVYGMLTSSFYSTLAGVYLPGRNCLLQRVDSKMLKPVFIGDKLLIEGRVTEKHDEFQMIIVKATIMNQNNQKVSKAIIQIGIMTPKY